MKRKERRDHSDDEPEISGEEWVEYGGQLIWAAGFTARRVPFGSTAEELRRLNQRMKCRAGWARAKALLECAFETCSAPTATVEVGRVTKVGEGLSRQVYAAEIDLSPDPAQLSGPWTVLLPGSDATKEDCARWVRELGVLAELARQQLPFRVPSPLGAFPVDGRPVVIRGFLAGLPVDLRAGQMPSIDPAALVAQIAAAIHAVDVTSWKHRPPGGATRREHAEEVTRVFDELDRAEVEAVREWLLRHLPEDRAAVLVHGDLLGQNILVWPGEQPAVIDWEFCRLGDAAYDLAIVTRGARRPFQIDRGLDRLLDAYAAAGGVPIQRSDVHFHELCLAAEWYREALRDRGSEPPEQALARLHGLLRRAIGSTR